MPDRPILFSAPMVRALLDGRKTQTRRVLNPQPREGEEVIDLGGREFAIRCTASGDYWGMKQPRYAPGDRLWVKETYACHWATDDQKPSEICPDTWSVRYVADDFIRPAKLDDSTALLEQCRKLRNARFMPRWASRLTLLVQDVRVQRLQDISTDDAVAEGIEQGGFGSLWGWVDYTDPDSNMQRYYANPCASFRSLWNSIHGKKHRGANITPWDENPWVAAITFEVVRANIDALERPA